MKLYLSIIFLASSQFLNGQIVTVLNKMNPTCTSDGSITFSINSTNGPFDVIITNTNCIYPNGYTAYNVNSNTVTINGIIPCATDYTVTFFDFANSKLDTIIRQFPSPSPCLNMFASNSAISCMGNCDATATVVSGNGTAPYTYTWMPGSINSAIAANLCAGNYTIYGKDATGIEGASQLIILQPSNPCVGIEEYFSSNKISVYPNPVSSVLNIKTEEHFRSTTKIEITNVIGQIILILNYSNEIDVSHLDKGYYSLRITNSDNEQFHSKFIKQ